MKETVFVATVRTQKGMVKTGKITSVKLLPFGGKLVKVIVKVI